MHYTLIGKKIGMTQVYNEDNTLVPVTVVQAGPCPIIQVKNEERDGYNALQIGYGKRKTKRTTQALSGHYKKAGVKACQELKEVRCKQPAEQKVGEHLTTAGFQTGQYVDIIGTTKGQGFQGVVKRHGFSGGPASHGSMFHRRGGSYGQCQWPGEIDKGRPMPGRSGGVRRTAQNLQIINIITDQNLIIIKGSIPGPKGSSIIIRSAKKKPAAS